MSVSLSFMREYLDRMVKADQWAPYVDDLGIAVKNATDNTRNVRAISQYIRRGGVKRTIDKCFSGVRLVEFLGRNSLSEGVSPQPHKIQSF